jgi:hypothetical protein
MDRAGGPRKRPPAQHCWVAVVAVGVAVQGVAVKAVAVQGVAVKGVAVKGVAVKGVAVNAWDPIGIDEIMDEISPIRR